MNCVHTVIMDNLMKLVNRTDMGLTEMAEDMCGVSYKSMFSSSAFNCGIRQKYCIHTLMLLNTLYEDHNNRYVKKGGAILTRC